MKFESLNRWLTLGANLGVVAGLVILIFEINQNTLHTRALLMDQVQSRIADSNKIYLDENPASIIEKSLHFPGDLSFAEFRVVDAYLINSINIMESLRLLAEAGLIDEDEWRSNVEVNVGWFFGNEYAIAWWNNVGRTAFSAELTEALDAAIREVGDDETYKYYLESVSGFRPPE